MDERVATMIAVAVQIIVRLVMITQAVALIVVRLATTVRAVILPVVIAQAVHLVVLINKYYPRSYNRHRCTRSTESYLTSNTL